MEKCAKTLLSDNTTDLRHNDWRSGRYFDRKLDLANEGVAEVVAEFLFYKFNDLDFLFHLL